MREKWSCPQGKVFCHGQQNLQSALPQQFNADATSRHEAHGIEGSCGTKRITNVRQNTACDTLCSLSRSTTRPPCDLLPCLKPSAWKVGRLSCVGPLPFQNLWSAAGSDCSRCIVHRSKLGIYNYAYMRKSELMRVCLQLLVWVCCSMLAATQA